MPPLEGRPIEVKPKSPEEQRQEQELRNREAEAYTRARGIPCESKKRGNAQSAKSLYQTIEQEGTDEYTRAWVERSKYDPLVQSTSIHTDTVTYGPRGIERRRPESGPDSRTERVSLSYDGIATLDVDYSGLNIEQKLGVVSSIEDTLAFIAQDAAAEAIRRA